MMSAAKTPRRSTHWCMSVLACSALTVGIAGCKDDDDKGSGETGNGGTVGLTGDGDTTASGDAGTTGSSGGQESGSGDRGEAGEQGSGDTGSSSSESGGSDSSTTGDPVGCPASERNACGGCTELDETVGDPCGGCTMNMWGCDGMEAVTCQGVDPAADDYWPDNDGDGFGDKTAPKSVSCSDPGAGWSTNRQDCDDTDADIHPDGVETCNGVDDNCNNQVDEGPANSFCTDVCCAVDKQCNGTACVEKCSGGEICGENFDQCCGAGQVCYGNQCITPGGNCEFTEECAADEVCASGVDECVPATSVPACEFMPMPGVFAPQEGCRWTPDPLGPWPLHDDVVATPIVINLTDDNLDGKTDADDIPDVAFLSYDLGVSCCNTTATLRIVSGQCKADGTMSDIASIDPRDLTGDPDIQLTNDSGLAAADLDGDGVPEIVAVSRLLVQNSGRPQGVMAFKRTSDDGSSWEILWHNTSVPAWDIHTRGGPVVSIADLEGDGFAEVIIGNAVVNGQTGATKWDGAFTSGGTGGIGNNGFLGPSSTIADLDLDGFQEVIAGNTVYNADGSVKWHFDYTTSNSECSFPSYFDCDGFNGVGDFNDDGFGDVVVVRLGEVFIFDHLGALMHRIVLPLDDCVNPTTMNPRNESGPPTIADFDGDGRPEIGTASSDFYVVVDIDCLGNPAGCSGDGLLWHVPNQDCSSRVTASSVFDFEGDGKAEVVYADEISLKIFDGTDGTELFADNTFTSHTRIEMPVVVDVDNDGNSEIVVGQNASGGGVPGVEIWEDNSDNWVRTRRIWNQHAYYVTNVTEDGRIPAVREINWHNGRLNNFRQNVQPDGLFDAPDASIRGVQCNLRPADDAADLSIVVKNEGALQLPAGTPVRLILDDGMGGGTTLLDTATTRRLLPGQFEIINVQVSIPMGVAPPFDVRAEVDPDMAINECVEDNNDGLVTCFAVG